MVVETVITITNLFIVPIIIFVVIDLTNFIFLNWFQLHFIISFFIIYMGIQIVLLKILIILFIYIPLRVGYKSIFC